MRAFCSGECIEAVYGATNRAGAVHYRGLARHGGGLWSFSAQDLADLHELLGQ